MNSHFRPSFLNFLSPVMNLLLQSLSGYFVEEELEPLMSPEAILWEPHLCLVQILLKHVEEGLRVCSRVDGNEHILFAYLKGLKSDKHI